jgi:hypothetical protein
VGSNLPVIVLFRSRAVIGARGIYPRLLAEAGLAAART